MGGGGSLTCWQSRRWACVSPLATEPHRPGSETGSCAVAARTADAPGERDARCRTGSGLGRRRGEAPAGSPAVRLEATVGYWGAVKVDYLLGGETGLHRVPREPAVSSGCRAGGNTPTGHGPARSVPSGQPWHPRVRLLRSWTPPRAGAGLGQACERELAPSVRLSS